MSSPPASETPVELPRRDFARSRLAARLAAAALVAGLLVAAVALRPEAPRDPVEAYVCEAAERWRAEHGGGPDLRLVRVDVHFPADPDAYVHATGLVAAPVAMDLEGAQEVLATDALPAPVSEVDFQGIRNLFWRYAGELTRERRYLGLALVRRPVAEPAVLPTVPTFEGLAPEARVDATLAAAELEEHGLDDCKAFPEWAREAAGDGPYPERMLRLAEVVRGKLKSEADENRAEDVCAGIREGKLDLHQAQVAVVLGAREVGAPAFGFAGADPERIYLVGTYVDGPGWIVADLDDVEPSFVSGGPALLARAPLLLGFEASVHGYWNANAGVYEPDDSGWGDHALGYTSWLGRPSNPPEPGRPTTTALSRPLAEVCR